MAIPAPGEPRSLPHTFVAHPRALRAVLRWMQGTALPAVSRPSPSSSTTPRCVAASGTAWAAGEPGDGTDAAAVTRALCLLPSLLSSSPPPSPSLSLSVRPSYP